MCVQVMALLTVNEDAPDSLAEYFRVTQPLLDKASARIVQRFAINEVVVGRRPARMLVLVEYPTLEALDLVFGSPEYERVKPVRDRAFLSYHIAVVENALSGEANPA